MSEEFTDVEWCVDVPFSTIHIKVKDRKGKPGKLIGTARDIYDANLMAASGGMYRLLSSIDFDDGAVENALGADFKDSVLAELSRARGEL